MVAAGTAGGERDFGRVSTHLIVGLLFSTFVISYVRSEDWSYSGDTGPEFWSEHYPNCGGQKQSPINVDSQSATYAEGLRLTFINYDQSGDDGNSVDEDDNSNSGEFTVTNNGHSVQVDIPSSARVAIKHGLLPNRYTLAQFHFHWGSNDAFGSEHTLDNKSYAMEIHLVHYNSDLYPDVATAANKTAGLAVLGTFVKVEDSADYPEMDSLVSHFPEIPYKGDKTKMPSFKIRSLLPASDTDYFRYSGSLTTPPCYESVIWSIFRSQVAVTSTQIKQFRTLLHSNVAGEPDEFIVNNFRPTQPLNGRTVSRSF